MRTEIHRSDRVHFSHEALESRCVLSGAPVVTAVEWGSTQWDSSFNEHLGNESLGENGYAVAAGLDQTHSLPWVNLDRLTIAFDQDVEIDINDLTLTGVNSNQHHPISFFYDPQAQTAEWTFAQAFAEERLLIDLNADGADPITNLSGDRLDGEWTDSVSTFTSGDGVAGGDFEFTVVITPGDVDRDTWVSYFDSIYVYYGGGVTTADPTYQPLYDVDGNGAVDLADYDLVFARLGTGAPLSDPAGVANNAPDSAPNAYLDVEDNAIDYAIDLDALFEDVEDADSLLSYTVVQNDAAYLFDSLNMSASTGELIVNGASGVAGRARVVVQAEDTSGLASITTVTIDVNRDNLPPKIQYFHSTPHIDGTIQIIAFVTDPDDDTTGWTVDIGGALDTRAAVWDDSWIDFRILDDPSLYGPIVATVSDPHGATASAFASIGYS